MPPDVTVVIPTYNRRNLLPKAVASCFEGNEGLAIEVVVVDDGSTDGTRQWGESRSNDRVRYFRQENQGAQVARNRGMEHAEGRYIKFLDDDDELTPAALTKEVGWLEDERAVLCSGHLICQSPEGEHLFSQEPAPDLISGIFKGSVWTHPHTLLYRRDAIQECYWDPSIPYHQDTAFAIQALTQGLSEVVLDQPVAVYRDHEGDSISNNRKSQASSVERAELQVELIGRGIERLRQHDCLKEYHLEAAVDGMWQWAHIISGYEVDQFDRVFERIRSICPHYMPERRRPLLSGMDLLFGPDRTERAIYPLRKAKRMLESGE